MVNNEIIMKGLKRQTIWCTIFLSLPQKAASSTLEVLEMQTVFLCLLYCTSTILLDFFFLTPFIFLVP